MCVIVRNCALYFVSVIIPLTRIAVSYNYENADLCPIQVFEDEFRTHRRPVTKGKKYILLYLLTKVEFLR